MAGRSAANDASSNGQQPPSAKKGPVFFLSYAHSLPDEQGGTDPDVWVGELYRDLCGHVRELAGLPKDTPPGFMDRDQRLGQEWPDQLADALATCRVFVPLYSRRYFRSEHCGKEWFAFDMRRINHKARTRVPLETIIPALWIPLPDGMLPEAARSVHYKSVNFNTLYGEHGFYGIMKVRRWRDIYEEAAYFLAKQIVAAAEVEPAVPHNWIPYASLPPAFGGNDAELGTGDKQLRITVVAPNRDYPSEGGSSAYYGDDSSEWNPYQGDSVRSLAAHAADVAKSLSYTPQVGDLFQRGAARLEREPPSGPEVLLIDPRATTVPEYLELLQRLDSMDQPWVRVIVVWNRSDHQVRAERERLAGALGTVLPRKLQEGRATSSAAVRGTSTLEEFGRVLPLVLAEASRAYLRATSERLPQAPQIAQGPLVPQDLADSEDPGQAGE